MKGLLTMFFFFEVEPLVHLIGIDLVLYLFVFCVITVLCFLILTLYGFKIKSGLPKLIFIVISVSWLLMGIGIIDWLFMEHPLYRKFHLRSISQIALNNYESYSSAKLLCELCGCHDPDLEKINIMLNRILFNRSTIDTKQVLDSIKTYSEKYHVEPVLLFYWLYIASFYGEATSGRIPLSTALTPETVRDIIQVHLPAWFVESRMRKMIIRYDKLDNLDMLGHDGKKWRYAFQKATYDVSMEPYDTNIFSDTFLILTEYKQEFPEIFRNPHTIIDRIIKETFESLKGKALLKPYEMPYRFSKYDKQFYQEYRTVLIKFARAIYYKTLLDFNFATKVQALVARYYFSKYKTFFGAKLWDKISIYQKMSLVAMLRDVFTPNIGKLTYNLYALPEFNCVPFLFVVQSINEPNLLLGAKIWLPEHKEYLWAGATTKLAVLSEVLQAFYKRPLQGVAPANSIREAKKLMFGEENG